MPGLGVILSLTSFQVIFRLMFASFLIEQLEGVMESGSTVSSSFGHSPDLISHFGPFADGATVKKKVILLSFLIVNRHVHAVFKISYNRFSGAQRSMVYDSRTATFGPPNQSFLSLT